MDKTRLDVPRTQRGLPTCDEHPRRARSQMATPPARQTAANPPARRAPLGHVGKRRERAEGWWRSSERAPPPPQNAHLGGTPAVTLLTLQSSRRGRPPKQCQNTGTAARQSLQPATGQKHPSQLLPPPILADGGGGRAPGGRPRVGRDAIGLRTSHTSGADLAALSCPYCYETARTNCVNRRRLPPRLVSRTLFNSFRRQHTSAAGSQRCVAGVHLGPSQ